MTELLKKSDLLRTAGYRYDFDREVYVNRGNRKVLSLEFIEDHDERELQRLLAEQGSDGWVFHFNTGPSLAVRRELEALLSA